MVVKKEEKEVRKAPVDRPAAAGKKSLKFGGTGRRKRSVARVWLTPHGDGTIKINGRELEDYTGGRPKLKTMVFEPFLLTGTLNQFRMDVKVLGGGVASQIGAVRHGLSRALIESDAALRTALAKAGMLTRDPREKERKKYGRKRARKGFQYSKR